MSSLSWYKETLKFIKYPIIKIEDDSNLRFRRRLRAAKICYFLTLLTIKQS